MFSRVYYFSLSKIDGSASCGCTNKFLQVSSLIVDVFVFAREGGVKGNCELKKI